MTFTTPAAKLGRPSAHKRRHRFSMPSVSFAPLTRLPKRQSSPTVALPPHVELRGVPFLARFHGRCCRALTRSERLVSLRQRLRCYGRGSALQRLADASFDDPVQEGQQLPVKIASSDFFLLVEKGPLSAQVER